MQVGHLAHVCCSTLRRLLGYCHQPYICDDSDAGCQRGPNAGVPKPSKGRCMHQLPASAIGIWAHSTAGPALRGDQCHGRLGSAEQLAASRCLSLPGLAIFTGPVQASSHHCVCDAGKAAEGALGEGPCIPGLAAEDKPPAPASQALVCPPLHQAAARPCVPCLFRSIQASLASSWMQLTHFELRPEGGMGKALCYWSSAGAVCCRHRH